MKKWLVISGVVVVLGYWWWQSTAVPLPGEGVADLGRDHVPVGTSVAYNSNPPTSGPHSASWTKRGMYEEAIEDGYLIHSLEHGYVIVSYKCEGECQELKDKLKAFYNKNKSKRLIVVVRPDLDVPVALTAWNRISKLESWDGEVAGKFLRAWENRGPEKTME